MKKSALCFGTFPVDSCFEIHLQMIIFCICGRALIYPADRDFDVLLCVSVTSGDTVSVWGVESPDELC